jgi:hypothetical protein
MIDPKELMSGNYIKYLHSENEFSEVVGFDSENIILNEITHDYVQFDECEPIPITGEWLERFGFEIDADDDYYYTIELKESHCLSIQIDVSICYVGSTMDWVNIKYPKHVNELQNLFFSLTGKQLTLKDKS